MFCSFPKFEVLSSKFAARKRGGGLPAKAASETSASRRVPRGAPPPLEGGWPEDIPPAGSTTFTGSVLELGPSFSRRALVWSFQAKSSAGEETRIVSLDRADASRAIVQNEGLIAYLSPDARYMAFVSGDGSESQKIYVRTCGPCRPDLGLPDRTWRVSSGGGTAPRWSPAGNEIFYLRGATMMSVPVRPERAFYDTPTVLFDAVDYVLDQFGNPNYDVTPDGQRFVMVKRGNSPDSQRPIDLVVNWFEELRAKVPVTGK